MIARVSPGHPVDMEDTAERRCAGRTTAGQTGVTVVELIPLLGDVGRPVAAEHLLSRMQCRTHQLDGGDSSWCPKLECQTNTCLRSGRRSYS